MTKESVYIFILAFIFLLSGCQLATSGVVTPVAATQTQEFATEQAPTQTEPTQTEPTSTVIVEKNEPPSINHFNTEIGSLCQGSQTKIYLSVSDPEDDPIEIRWEAEYGQVIQDGSDFFYQSPNEHPNTTLDTLTLNVSDAEHSVFKSIPLLLITHDDTQNWIQTNGPEGGVMTTIEIDPRNPDILYAGGSGGSLIKTKNGGETWEVLPKFIESSVHIQEILLHPTDTDILYVRASTLYKSDDGGITYQNIIQDRGGISSLDLNRTNPDQLLAGTWQGQILLSENGGKNWRQSPVSIPPNTSISAVAFASESEFWAGTRDWVTEQENFGILYHSTDGGTTWEIIENTNFVAESAVQSIMVTQDEPKTVYVGLMDINNEPWDTSKDRFFMKSSDGGETWQRLTFGGNEHWVGIVDLIDQPSWDDTLYVGSGGNYIFKSTNGGDTFPAIRLLGDNGDIVDMAVDPRDPAVLYIPARAYGIQKSYDGGQTWEWINNGLRFMGLSLLETNPNASTGVVLGASVAGEGQFISENYGEAWSKVPSTEITHPWGDELKINPHNPEEYWYVADIGQVFVTRNGGTNWNMVTDPQHSSFGFRFGSTYSLAVAPSNPDRLYVEKNGFGIFRGTSDEDGYYHWNFLHHSEVDYTFSTVVHPEDENIIYSGFIPKPFQDFAFIRKSMDGGDNWETVLEVVNSSGITSVALAAGLPNRIYAASTGDTPQLYRSDNGGNNWKKLNSPWKKNSIEGNNISYIEIVPHPVDMNIVYVSTYPGGIFYSSDGGDNWESIGFDLPSYSVVDGLRQGRYNLSISQSDPDTLYVGIFDEGVFKSTNNGKSWELTNSITTNLGILALAIDPENKDLVFIGSRAGVFRSDDGGLTWSEFQNGRYFADTDVRTLVYGPDGTLFAGTLGYEVFKLRPGDSSWDQINPHSNFGTFWPIWNGRPLYQYTFLEFHPSDPNVILFGTFPAGIYISRDGGESWQESNTNWTWDGVFSLVFHPEDSNIIFSGTYNGVNRSTDGGKTWELWDVGWPDEQWVFSIDFDPRDSNVMYAVSKNGENQGQGQPGIFMGTVMKSLDGGETWFEIMRGLPRDNEYYKIIVDPYSPDVLYLASQFEGVFISMDQGESWMQWNEGLFNILSGTNGNNVANTMAISPDGLHLYFASAGSGVFRRMTVKASEICGCLP